MPTLKENIPVIALSVTVMFLGYLALLGFDRQLKAQVNAAESTARAEWAQVYWLKKQAQMMEVPCCMCE